MILYENWEIFVSVLFYFSAKIFRLLSMLRQNTLSSIPERNEEEEPRKWVPKKKHEVLKAKYKCLKKLFQLYDASVIGILPEPSTEYTETPVKHRRKRSHRTKTDACAGTTEISNGDISSDNQSEYDRQSITTDVIKDLKINQSCSTHFDTKEFKCSNTNISKTELNAPKLECTCNRAETESNASKDCNRNTQHQIPYLVLNERRKLTRFQCFVQRIFGIRRDTFILQGDDYAASDSMRERRRRRGLRFRRLRRAKKIKSETDMNNMKSPAILSCVQSVQRHCLMDTTSRLCPIPGCKMISYGIINYNDHLNICHFKDRKYICHYCHEGFEMEYEKLVHENEHIGINKLTTISNCRQKVASNSNTQTDPDKNEIPEEKLKKIVSFFDKINNPEDIIAEVRKNRSSETNMHSKSVYVDTESSIDSSDKRTVSCVNIRKCQCQSESEATCKHQEQLINCHFCGEHFDHRRQLSLHVDLEHRVHDKFSKFHSCAGIISKPKRDLVSEDGRLNVQSIDSSANTQTPFSGITTPTVSESTMMQCKSEESLSCDPSTNIVYYTSVESIKKPSVLESLVNKVRSYRWEPETKIVRV